MLLAFFVPPQESFADPIDTDGPDFVESSEVVGRHRFQFETHVLAERDRRDSRRRSALSTPTLFRYGVTNSVELRFETEGLVRDRDESSELHELASGTGDSALGLKWHSQDRNSAKGVPSVAWITHLDLPSGSDDFQGHGLRPSLRSVITWDLPDGFALGLMPGLKYDATPEGKRFVSGILGVVLNWRWSASFRTFIESSMPRIARSENGGVLHHWDAGAAYLLNDDWQVGIRAGVAANRNTPDSYVLLELAARF